MKKLPNSFVVTLFVLILICVISVGGYYFVRHNKDTNKTQVLADKTTGWKTSSNTQYGFDFKYPQDWNLEVVESISNSVKERIHIASGGYSVYVSYSDGIKDFGGELIDGVRHIAIGNIDDVEIFREKEPVDSEIPSQTLMYIHPSFCKANQHVSSKDTYPLNCDYEVNGNNTSVGFQYTFEKQVIANGVNRETLEKMDEIVKSFNFTNIYWTSKSINSKTKIIKVQDVPAMLVQENTVFELGNGGEFKDVEFSPDGTKAAFAVRNAAHDFGWVYDFTKSKFIPLAFQFDGGVDVIVWKSNNEVTLKLSTPKPSTFEKTFNLYNLDEYPRVADGFTFEFGEPYNQAKKRLVENGWIAKVPTNQINIIDKEYPEITSCGSGLDAFCNVNFRKGNENRHLNVQKGGRNSYAVWTVVGNE